MAGPSNSFAATGRNPQPFSNTCVLDINSTMIGGLLYGIFYAAKAGRLLPRLTVILLPHAVVHWLMFLSTSTCTAERLEIVSMRLMFANLSLNVVGYTVLIHIYRHSVRTIFNRKIPTVYDKDYLVQSFIQHLLMLRPLEIVFRFMTAPLRVLPDVIVLGEVRCGTTNLCGHLVSLTAMSSESGRRQMNIKCYTPFCAWHHPELDHKESFYFVGHYLGIVDPYFYRMAFPLRITRWWEEFVMGNLFFCFDGCAQYLTSPSAPYLIASAYQGSALPPPVLVACLRNPVEQAISWWKFENNSIAWGESIGLKEWDTDLRSTKYPPKTIHEALEFSGSQIVDNAYKDAEKLVEGMIHVNNKGHANNLFSKIFRRDIKRLPSWAITWPMAQLSSIGRNGKYLRNINKYNAIFRETFGKKEVDASTKDKSSKSFKVGLVHLVPLEHQSDGCRLKSSIRPFLSDIIRRCAHRRNLPYTAMMNSMDDAINVLCKKDKTARRNSSAELTHWEKEPGHVDKSLLEEYFQEDIEWYASLLKQS